MMNRTTVPLLAGALLVLSIVVGSGGCAPTPSEESDGLHNAPLTSVGLPEGQRLKAVATTSIVADVVKQVGGDLVEVATLLPLGADPHAFDPTPRDVASVADAHVVFANGAGLEVFLQPMLESAGRELPTVSVSDGVSLLEFGGTPDEHDEEHEEDAGDEHDHRAGADPHVWFDPHAVMAWTESIAAALTALDPANADSYEANAHAYQVELVALDTWIKKRVAEVPQESRKLVTDHASLGYFASRYGFEQVGVVVPGYSTLAEPSARELAQLQQAIREQNVKAVFVGLSVNPALAERVAQDTGTQLVFIYTGSLSEPGGPAGDYIAFMKHNVNAIVEALN